MTSEKRNVKKSDVSVYWDDFLCGSKFGNASKFRRGSKDFFEEVEYFRYQIQPHLYKLIHFERYKDKKVLEIGMGLGTDLIQFERAGALVTGIDLAPKAVELVQERFKLFGRKGDLRIADAENLPFDDSSFDAVYSFGVIHHTPDTEKAIAEVFRVLKPNGEAILMLYYKYSVKYYLEILLFRGILRGALMRMNREELLNRSTDGEGNPISRVYTRRNAGKLLRGAGFKRIRFRLAYLPKYRITWVGIHLPELPFDLLSRVVGWHLMIWARKPSAQSKVS